VQPLSAASLQLPHVYSTDVTGSVACVLCCRRILQEIPTASERPFARHSRVACISFISIAVAVPRGEGAKRLSLQFGSPSPTVHWTKFMCLTANVNAIYNKVYTITLTITQPDRNITIMLLKYPIYRFIISKMVGKPYMVLCDLITHGLVSVTVSFVVRCWCFMFNNGSTHVWCFSHCCSNYAFLFLSRSR
jgi:hypothetical protein